MFRQILRGMDSRYLSKPMTVAYKQVKASENSKYTFDKIVAEAHEIESKYLVYLSYKTVDEAVDRKQNFLLKDATYHTIFSDDKKYIRAEKNEEENRVDIFFETRERFYENSRKTIEENNISVYALLREINRFLGHFRIFLFSWARKYMKLINKERDPKDDEMTLENALSSILRKFELNYAGQQLILSEMRDITDKRKKKELLPDISFYQRGIELFELEDQDAHHDATNLSLVAFYDTPERIITFLAEKATVIGMSATAEIPSVVGNYDLRYLKNKLGDLFHPTPEDEKKRVQAEISKVWKAYDEGRVTIVPEVIKDQSVNFDAQEVCGGIFKNPDLAMICANKIQNTISEPYYELRYCNIAKAMHKFVESDIQSMLYLGTALPKKNESKSDEDLIRDMFDLVLRDCETEADITQGDMHKKDNPVILRSANFDDEKESLLNRLAGGEKIFIMSSYQTLGAGQNLQYGAPNKEKFVELVPDEGNGDKRHINKDIDAIYLGDVTNLIVNTRADKRLSESELIKALFQIEELKENREIYFPDADEMIKLAFCAYTGRKSSNQQNKLYKTDSVKMQATMQVMQAIGRMCRTYLKSEKVYIFIEEKLLEKLSAGELKKHILPPEMQVIVKLREELGTEYSPDDQKVLREAEGISDFGMWRIREMLSRNWTEDSMELWKQLRQLVLKYPTASEAHRARDTQIEELYITSGEKQNRYFYSQYSDFKYVTIDFGTDAVAFRNSGRAKLNAYSGDVVVYEMSEIESGLPSMMAYPGMKDYFTEKGYATTFEKNDYMMSPVLFHNIYKGALGEVAGSFILEKELGLKLSKIEEPSKFEFFDYEMSDGVYVDFKNWKFSYFQDRDAVKQEILRKLETIGGKRVYIINIVGDEDYVSTASNDGRIIEIPCLIGRQGHPISKFINMIREEDF